VARGGGSWFTSGDRQLPAADRPVPPPEVLPPYARQRDYVEAGRAFLEAAIQHGLEPDHRVLDLGCGVGRFAVALTDYLDESGSYDGIDVSWRSIEICDRWIGSRFERFRFHLAKVFNTHYSPESEAGASEYRFPFPDKAFDFVFSNSLFTHLMPEDVGNYINELARVLKPGSRTLNTFMLLNDESRAAIEAGKSQQRLPHVLRGGLLRVQRLDLPEAVTAHDEAFVRERHRRAGLEVQEPIRYGEWSGREPSGPGFSPQDVVRAVRR
jgi:SAM-dependent methyltransferase